MGSPVGEFKKYAALILVDDWLNQTAIDKMQRKSVVNIEFGGKSVVKLRRIRDAKNKIILWGLVKFHTGSNSLRDKSAKSLVLPTGCDSSTDGKVRKRKERRIYRALVA